jgi:hypothetical protein
MQATPGITRTTTHAGQACVECVPFSVSVIRVYVVSTIAHNCGQSWTTACSPPWISPACPRSFRIRAGYLTRCCPQEHTCWNVLPWTSDSPTTLTCMRICIRAWHPLNGVPLPDASPIQPVAGQGEEHMTAGHPFFSVTSLFPPCSAMSRDGEPLHLVHVFYSIAKGSCCQEIGYVVVCISVAAVVNVVSITNFEIGAHAPVSLCALLLLAFLLTNLTLTGLARLAGLQSLVGLTTKLATSTA